MGANVMLGVPKWPVDVVGMVKLCAKGDCPVEMGADVAMGVPMAWHVDVDVNMVVASPMAWLID